MKKITLIKILLFAFWIYVFNECLAQWEFMEPIPTPRSQATASTLNGKIYVIGGFQERGGDAMTTVEAYDPRTNNWDTTIADYPLPVAYTSSQVVNGALFVIGGTDKEHIGDTYYTEVYAYDDKTDTWTRKADLPINNAYHKTVVVRDTIYILGGTSGGVSSSKVYAYVSKEDKWISMPDIPANRSFHIVQGVGHDIYVMGGAHLNVIHSSAFRFDVDRKEWSPYLPLPAPIAMNGIGKLDNEIYVFGGMSDWANGITSQKTWKLQIETDTIYWVDVQTDMPEEVIGYAYAVAADEKGRLATYMFSGATRSFYTQVGEPTLSPNTRKFAPERNTLWKYMAPMPTPRALTAYAELDRKIYIIGGVFSRTGLATNTVEAYDIATDTWDTDIAPLPEPVCNATAQGVYHIYDPDSDTYYDRVYVIGGSDYHLGPGKKTTYEYDPETNAWTRMADMDIALSGHASTYLQTRIRTIGGIGENGMATNTVMEFFPGQNRWEPFMPLSIPRAFSTAVTISHEVRAMLVFGGINLGEPVQTMEGHGGLSQWMNRGEMPVGRYWHGAGMADWDTVFVYGGLGEGNQPLFDIAKYNWRTEEWFKVDEVLPEYSSPFASAVVKEGEQACLYAIGGPTYDFWSEGNGPLVTGLNLKYCIPTGTTSSDGNLQTSGSQLFQNFPNPFSRETNIPFELEKAGNITLDLINLSGQKVASIFSGYLNSGVHSILLEGNNIPSGVYIYQLKTNDGIAVKKLIVQHPE